MRLRSTTSVENTVELYAPLTPAYTTKTKRAATLVVMNARVRGSRSSDRGRASAATPSRTGSTPTPIASAPSAQLACSKSRSLYRSMVLRHASDPWPIVAISANAMPSASVTAPTQSQVVHRVRQRRATSDCHASESRPTTRTTKRIASCVRVSTATTHIANAAATRPFDGRSSDRAISQSESVDTGYASGSSTRKGEYASAGTATDAPAAASAYHFGTTIRASP